MSQPWGLAQQAAMPHITPCGLLGGGLVQSEALLIPVNRCGIGRPETPCGLSRSALPPTREGYAGHP